MFWFHACRDNTRKVAEELFRSLNEAWRAELEAATGTPMILPENPSTEILDLFSTQKDNVKPKVVVSRPHPRGSRRYLEVHRIDGLGSDPGVVHNVEVIQSTMV